MANSAETAPETKTAAEEKPKEVPKEKEKPKLVLSKDMPVEELLTKMTLEYAKSIVVDYGFDKDKNLGQIAVERPKGIEYHASHAKNNLIRAGAMFLLEQAKTA